jgi:hypothetical protein
MLYYPGLAIFLMLESLTRRVFLRRISFREAKRLICIRRTYTMTYNDKIQLTVIIIAPPDQATEGDRIFKSHRTWMEATHYRTGEKALLTYLAQSLTGLDTPA